MRPTAILAATSAAISPAISPATSETGFDPAAHVQSDSTISDAFPPTAAVFTVRVRSTAKRCR